MPIVNKKLQMKSLLICAFDSVLEPMIYLCASALSIASELSLSLIVFIFIVSRYYNNSQSFGVQQRNFTAHGTMGCKISPSSTPITPQNNPKYQHKTYRRPHRPSLGSIGSLGLAGGRFQILPIFPIFFFSDPSLKRPKK